MLTLIDTTTMFSSTSGAASGPLKHVSSILLIGFDMTVYIFRLI